MNYAARKLCAMRMSSLVLLVLSSIALTRPGCLMAQRPGLAESLSPFAMQKAERLLRDKRSCLGCHVWRGEGGMIAPALDGVRERRSAAYIAAMITDPQRVVPGAAMPRERMPATERALLIRYLGGDASVLYKSTAAVRVAVDTSPAALYGRWCASCHGVAGGGDGPNAARLPVPPARHADARTTALRSDDALFDTIHSGGAVMNRSARMPAFGGTLSDGQIRGLVRYVRTLCRCDGPAWSRTAGAP